MTRWVVRCAVVLAAAAAGCGGEDEKDVRNAIGRFASATETEDARTACRAVTPDTRELLGRLAVARLGRGSCVTLLDARFRASGGASFAIDAATLAAVEEAKVEIDGNRAVVDTFGDREHVPLERSGGEWRLDLLRMPAQNYSIRASVACTERDAALLRAPLPEPTRAGYAATARGQARRNERLAAAIARLEAPRDGRDAHLALVRGLRTRARELRRIAADVVGDAPVLETVASHGRVLRTSERRTAIAQRALDVSCDPSGSRAGATEYRAAGERVCRAVSRRIQRLAEPADAAGLGPYMKRVRAAGAVAGRGLRRLDPPAGLASLHRRTVAAYGDALDAIPAIAASADGDAAYDAYGLRSLRAATGFSRLGLPTCASL